MITLLVSVATRRTQESTGTEDVRDGWCYKEGGGGMGGVLIVKEGGGGMGGVVICYCTHFVAV